MINRMAKFKIVGKKGYLTQFFCIYLLLTNSSTICKLVLYDYSKRNISKN